MVLVLLSRAMIFAFNVFISLSERGSCENEKRKQILQQNKTEILRIGFNIKQGINGYGFIAFLL